MVSKDQAIGGVILIVCALVGILYFITLVWPGPAWLNWIGIGIKPESELEVRVWIVAVPVLVAFIAIMGIGAWIGWTMATTPPPKPIEEITSEMSEEKEEPKVEEAQPPQPVEEEKKPEKKKKIEK